MDMNESIKGYENVKASAAYAIGFDFKGGLYMINTDTLTTIERALKVEKVATSKGAGEKIRIRFTNMIKACMIANRKAFRVGDASELEFDGMKNRGECFERWYYEKHGREWHKDSTPFYVAGDINVGGVEIQIKFDGATLVTEKTLARATA